MGDSNLRRYSVEQPQLAQSHCKLITHWYNDGSSAQWPRMLPPLSSRGPGRNIIPGFADCSSWSRKLRICSFVGPGSSTIVDPKAMKGVASSVTHTEIIPARPVHLSADNILVMPTYATPARQARSRRDSGDGRGALMKEARSALARSTAMKSVSI